MQGMGNSLQNAPKMLQNFDNISKVTLGSHLQNENPLWKRKHGRYNADQKGGIRRKRKKSKKSPGLVWVSAPWQSNVLLSLSQKHTKQLCTKMESSLVSSPRACAFCLVRPTWMGSAPLAEHQVTVESVFLCSCNPVDAQVPAISVVNYHRAASSAWQSLFTGECTWNTWSSALGFTEPIPCCSSAPTEPDWQPAQPNIATACISPLPWAKITAHCALWVGHFSRSPLHNWCHNCASLQGAEMFLEAAIGSWWVEAITA